MYLFLRDYHYVMEIFMMLQMHSEFFAFILDNEFGFDTLTVNGILNAKIQGFLKLRSCYH